MTLLTESADRNKVGVHALLIGVGVYPYLEGGVEADKFPASIGMQQLSSPYHSVEAMSSWLQDKLKLSGAPLRTLRVLASSPEGIAGTCDAPTMAAIQESVGEWFEDADQHEDNYALFYFCGHGLLIGSVTALLAQDFGKIKLNPFQDSFDPARFESGMLSCKASRQLFILDACSSSPRTLLGQYQDITPSPLVEPVTGHNRLGVTKQAEIRASELGTEAFGQKCLPSVFMESFLKSMSGAGAIRDEKGRWVVKTNSLRTGVDWLVQRSVKKETQLVGFGAVSSDFAFHELTDDPIVPVKVICEPEELLASSSLSSTSGHSRPTPSEEAWHLDLPLGHYEFSARDQTTGVVHSEDEYASPQFTVVSIQCGDEP